LAEHHYLLFILSNLGLAALQLFKALLGLQVLFPEVLTVLLLAGQDITESPDLQC
jgi:hypothetical protein